MTLQLVDDKGRVVYQWENIESWNLETRSEGFLVSLRGQISNAKRAKYRRRGS